MQITCPECDKKLKVGDDLTGKKVRCPGCKALIPVRKPPANEDELPAPKKKPGKVENKIAEGTPPIKAPPKRNDADDNAMRCPKCDAAAIRALPPNKYSRNPGFACTECGAVMRPPGSTGFYLFATLLGGFIVLVGIGMMVLVAMSGTFHVRLLAAGGVAMTLGVSTAGWALKQMRLPIPINAPPPPSRLGFWIGLLVFLFIGLPCIGGVLFVGFMYFIKEML